jgi:hypothetical protein
MFRPLHAFSWRQYHVRYVGMCNGWHAGGKAVFRHEKGTVSRFQMPRSLVIFPSLLALVVHPGYAMPLVVLMRVSIVLSCLGCFRLLFVV